MQVLELGITPFKHLWYIWALLCWRMLIPYWMQLQHPLFISLVLAVASGFLDVDPTFMVYRVIYYFPYFVAGAVVQQKWLTHLFQFISTKRVKVWAWCMLIGGLWAFVYTYTIGMKPQCVFMMKWSYVTIHHETVNNIYGCGKGAQGCLAHEISGMGDTTMFMTVSVFCITACLLSVESGHSFVDPNRFGVAM